MFNALTHNEERGLDLGGTGRNAPVRLVGRLLDPEKVAGVGELRPLVLGSVLAVDDHGDLDMAVSDGLAQGVLEDELRDVVLVRSSGEPQQCDGAQLADRS